METEEKLILKKILFTGIQINYFLVCPLKLWLFTHLIRMESNSENVKIGRIIHEESFKRESETIIDQKIAIDFVKKKDYIEVHEIKKSPALETAHYWQLMYYLYYLKNYKMIKNVKGVINYPKNKKIVEVELTEAKSKELENIIDNIWKIIKTDKPPEKKKLKYCKKCSYYEFCWGE
ncbi:MAG: CRISPR-associated protein Cas4 [Candidatus Pacearchaeota archaeon]